MKLCSFFTSKSHSSIFQSDINNLVEWCSNNFLTLYLKKSKTLSFSRGNTFTTEYIIVKKLYMGLVKPIFEYSSVRCRLLHLALSSVKKFGCHPKFHSSINKCYHCSSRSFILIKLRVCKYNYELFSPFRAFCKDLSDIHNFISISDALSTIISTHANMLALSSYYIN